MLGNGRAMTARKARFGALATLVLFALVCPMWAEPSKAATDARQEQMARFRAQAEKFADRVALKDYSFLGVSLFEHFDPTGFTKGVSDPEGITVYNGSVEGSAFPRKSISVAPDGTAVAILGFKAVASGEDGKAFMRNVVDAMRDRFPALREEDEREEVFSVVFTPRPEFVQSYAELWMPSMADLLERDTHRGYKSEFYYLQNVQPDDRLDFLRLLKSTINGQLYVVLHVETKQAAGFMRTQQERDKKNLKDQLTK